MKVGLHHLKFKLSFYILQFIPGNIKGLLTVGSPPGIEARVLCLHAYKDKVSFVMCDGSSTGIIGFSGHLNKW